VRGGFWDVYWICGNFLIHEMRQLVAMTVTVAGCKRLCMCQIRDIVSRLHVYYIGATSRHIHSLHIMMSSACSKRVTSGAGECFRLVVAMGFQEFYFSFYVSTSF